MLNICLFGAGRMAQDHAFNFHLCPETTLYGVVDPNQVAAQKIAETYGSKIYSSPQDAFIDSNIDAVAIVSSSDTHAELILSAAKAGKGIFCEKPVDLSQEKILNCIREVEKYKIPFLLGFNRRFDPSYRSLQDQVRSGVVGDIESVTITSRDCPGPSIDYLKRSGGMFHDMTIHDFDIARWILGEDPVEVYACGSAVIYPEIAEFGDIDTAAVILKTGSGKICQISNSRRTAFGYDQRLEVFGSSGMINAHHLLPTTVEIADERGITRDNPYLSFPQRYARAYQLEAEHFCRDVMNGAEPFASIYDGLKASCIADAAKLSLDSGKPQKIVYPV